MKNDYCKYPLKEILLFIGCILHP